ncbi:hypothetical protein [Maioricimonas sp. JC845]|uniref:hypothetical protein n=1 Tax=Maioricimonas sp. JC845 TaxID=3232138 RepID=UPI0034594DDB
MSQQKRLNAERLEERVLLAGNVAISVVGTTLGLTGDAAANDISVTTAGGQLTLSANNGTTFVGGPGVAALAPFVVATDFSTFVTLNNVFVNALATLPFVTVDIDMQGGNDTVSVESTTVGGNVVIDMGAGNDLLRMDQTTVGGDFTANFGDGADRAIATFNTWGDNLGPLEAINVNMGAGNDRIDYAGNVYLNTGAPLIDGGPGNKDRLELINGQPDDQYINTAPILPNWEIFDHEDDSPTGV